MLTQKREMGIGVQELAPGETVEQRSRAMKRNTNQGAGTGASARPICRLDELEVGRRGRVVAVNGPPELRRRLLEMGFCNAARVQVVRRAPWGDPIEFHLRGYHLSLRGEQARCVQVQPEDQIVR